MSVYCCERAVTREPTGGDIGDIVSLVQFGGQPESPAKIFKLSFCVMGEKMKEMNTLLHMLPVVTAECRTAPIPFVYGISPQG